MFKKFFRHHSLNKEPEQNREVFRRKSAIETLKSDDENNRFKSSVSKTTKTPSDEKNIQEAIANNEFISHIIKEKRLIEVTKHMYLADIKSNEIIIQEGEIGSQMFISAGGTFEIILNNKVLDYFDDFRVFGELAILYNERRKATIRCKTDCKVWILEGKIFKDIVITFVQEEHKEIFNFLQTVDKLNTVPKDVIEYVVGLLEKKFFPSNTDIIKEGDKGDHFYIIRAGTVQVSKIKEGIVNKLSKGQYFGELALIKEDVRAATVTAQAPGCECFILSRSNFIKHFGNISDFNSLSVSQEIREVAHFTDKYKNLTLEELVKVKTIGVGGYAKVLLVQHKTQKDMVFAVKILKKHKFELPEQRSYVLSEKEVQISCDCPFIIKLYKTFKDCKYLYFLLESQLGSDLWRLLYQKRRRPFDEDMAKFYVGCVVEAFNYLHDRGIVYRDLKPENLLIANNGYIKLADFGFAKRFHNEKSYSFVGTPEYIAPEMVLNRSHDKGVDYWALGIFTFELLACRTPFHSTDPNFMTTYNMIIKGISAVRFPYHISTKAKNIITKFCRYKSSDRLGYGINGFDDIRNEEWFNGFDWKKLKNFKMEAPYVPKLSSRVDTRYFSVFKEDTEVPPDDCSTWDEDF